LISGEPRPAINLSRLNRIGTGPGSSLILTPLRRRGFV
jgi:hypothetical protein